MMIATWQKGMMSWSQLVARGKAYNEQNMLSLVDDVKQ